jgi:hypothetical protein
MDLSKFEQEEDVKFQNGNVSNRPLIREMIESKQSTPNAAK